MPGSPDATGGSERRDRAAKRVPEGVASSIKPRPHPTRGKAKAANGQEARGRNPREPSSPWRGLPIRWQELVPRDLRLQHTLSHA